MIIVILIINISQRSLATQLRFLSIFSNHFITNVPQNAPVKKNENRSIFGENKDKRLRLIFWATLCTGQAYMDMDIYPWISTQNLWIWIWIWIWMGNLISTASLLISQGVPPLGSVKHGVG